MDKQMLGHLQSRAGGSLWCFCQDQKLKDVSIQGAERAGSSSLQTSKARVLNRDQS